jgi:transposase-like protein
MSRGKKARVFSREFKVKAVERMLAGESSSALARELKLRRKLLYQWKDAYTSSGPAALRKRGRPGKDQVLGSPPEAKTSRAELLQARQRIAELERKVGQQQLENDFFAEALRRVKVVEEDARNAQRSMRSSMNKRRKAD